MAVLVLDASMTMAAILPDEVNANVALGVIERVTVEGAVVPSLWRIEVGNALLMAERRNVILPDEGIVIRSRLAALAIKTDDETARLGKDDGAREAAWADTLRQHVSRTCLAPAPPSGQPGQTAPTGRLRGKSRVAMNTLKDWPAE